MAFLPFIERLKLIKISPRRLPYLNFLSNSQVSTIIVVNFTSLEDTPSATPSNFLQ